MEAVVRTFDGEGPYRGRYVPEDLEQVPLMERCFIEKALADVLNVDTGDKVRLRFDGYELMFTVFVYGYNSDVYDEIILYNDARKRYGFGVRPEVQIESAIDVPEIGFLHVVFPKKGIPIEEIDEADPALANTNIPFPDEFIEDTKNLIVSENSGVENFSFIDRTRDAIPSYPKNHSHDTFVVMDTDLMQGKEGVITEDTVVTFENDMEKNEAYRRQYQEFLDRRNGKTDSHRHMEEYVEDYILDN